MTKSRIFLSFCLSFIGGIFLNSLISIPKILVFAGLILGIFFISLFLKYKKFVIFGFCILFFIFGIWKYQITFFKTENPLVKKFIGQEVNLMGIVIEEPKINENKTKLVILPQEFEGEGKKNFGKILIFTERYPEYQYGDKLEIQGELQEPQIENGFNYKNYLAKDGIYSLILFPKIELIGKNFGNPITEIALSFKNRLKESLNSFLSPPQSGLLEALLFGDEENISKNWKEKFNLAGTRHITAVSGMNITIISVLILNSLLYFGLYRSQAIYFSIILIFFYILMTGLQASVLRAGIMGSLFLIAQYFGRFSNPFRAVIFAATIMLFLNPLLFKYDLGFQLSFLAMAGLIYLRPIFLNLFKKIPDQFQLRSNLATTFGAQVFTFPILIYNFGQISLVSPITNILIVPFLPLITILGFIFSFFGSFLYSLGQILSLPTWLLLNYILKIIDFSLKIPFASFNFGDFSWLPLLILYLILGIITWRLQEIQKLKFLMF